MLIFQKSMAYLLKLVFEDTNTFAAERAVDITEKYTGNEIIVELEEQ